MVGNIRGIGFAASHCIFFIIIIFIIITRPFSDTIESVMIESAFESHSDLNDPSGDVQKSVGMRDCSSEIMLRSGMPWSETRMVSNRSFSLDSIDEAILRFSIEEAATFISICLSICWTDSLIS